MVAITGMKFRHAASSYVKKGESTRLDHDTQEAERQGYCAKRRQIKRTQDPNNRYKAYAAGFDQLFFKKQYKSGKRPKMPAQKYYDYAWVTAQSSNLVIGGATGSGKTVMAWYLAITLHPIFCAFVIQHRRHPQRMNADYASESIPKEWRTRLESQRNTDDTEDTGDRYGCVDPISINTFVKTVGSNVKFTRESVKKKFSLNFITSGRFPYFFEGPGPMPTSVVLDEIHERCLSNDYAVHALLHLNIQLISQGRRPIRLMLASASGWQSIVNFLRKEYDLANLHCGVHDFTPVDIAEHIHPITEHFIPYREGHYLNAGDTHADEKQKKAAEIGFKDLFTEIFALLKASSFRYQTQKGSRWYSKPSMSLEKGAITLCFVPGGYPGNDLVSEVMKQSVVADTPAGEADYGGEQDGDQLRDPSRVYNHAIAMKGKGKGKDKKGDSTKGKSDDSTKGSGKKGGHGRGPRDQAGPRPVWSVEIGRISEDEAVPVRAYYLDGKMNGKDIQKVLQPHPDMHKILFVTNFLESSGTVQNVQNIIISGWELRLAYDSMRGTAVLKPVRISWRSYVQQRGRGGRDRPTEVYVLMPRTSQTSQMASIMSNSDEDLSDNILTMAKRSPTREISEFRAQEESPDEDISLREALESCRMVFNEGKRAITVLSRKQVILAIIELKFLGLITDSAINLRSRITQYGSLAASFGLRTRYNAMLTHPELRTERNHRLNDYNPSLFYFMLLSIGVVISAGRQPFVSDHALNKHAGRRNEAAREHEEEDARKGESGQASFEGDNRYTSKGYKGRPSGGKYPGTSGITLDSDSNWDLREVHSTYDNSEDIKRNRCARASRHNDHDRRIHFPGHAFYLDLGIHINGFLVVHNFIHYHLKKLTFTDQDGEVKPMTNEYFVTRYRARADNEPDYAGRGSLTGFLSRYGIQHKAMYLIIDLMQSIGRMHHIDWLSMPHFGTMTQQPADPDSADAATLRDAQQRREKLCDQVMMYIARWSAMNMALNTNKGNIFTLASGEQVFRRGHNSVEEMKDVQACKYVIFEELTYSKEGEYHYAGFMSGVARVTNADDVKIAAGYYAERKQLHRSLLEAAKHVNLGLNINHPTKLHFEAVSGEFADDTIYENPMGVEELARDTDLYEQPNQAITYNAENMAVFDSTSQLKLNEWAYVREKLRQPTNTLHWDRCLFEIQKEGNLQSVLGYSVSDHVAKDAADKQKAHMHQMGIRGMANSQNSRWWFACDQCNAMCRVVAGVFPPPHTHDQRFLNQLAAEFPEGLPEPATVDIVSAVDHRLGEVPMFVDGVHITADMAEQVRQEHLDRLQRMKSKDQYLEQAQEAHKQGVAMPSLDIDNDTHDHRSAQTAKQTTTPSDVPKYTYANASHPDINRCIERLNNWSRLIRHRGSSIMIDHYTGRVLLVNFDKQRGTLGRWTFPSGGAKNGEKVTEIIGQGRKVTFAGAFTAVRESREEAGVLSEQCEGMIIDGESQPRGPIAMTPLLRKRRGTTTYYVFVIPDLEAMYHSEAMFSRRSRADQRCIRSFQFVQFPYVTFAHCFRDVFPVLTSLYKQHPALLSPRVDLASFDIALPLPPHRADRSLGVQDPRVNPAHVDGDSLFDFVKNEGSNQKHLRQSSDWKDLKSDFFDLLNAVPPELFARLWKEGPNGVFPTESDDPVFSRSSLICQMVFGVTDQMHLMSYKGLSWFGMKTNEDLTEESQRACWIELVSCAQISMPREGEGPSWEVMLDEQVLQRSPAIQVLLNTQAGAVANPVCTKALEYLDYENKCAIEANEAYCSREAARAANATMPPGVEEFVKVFQNSVMAIEDNQERIMDQDCNYTKYGEYLEHMARYKDKNGKDMHGGGHALAKGEPAAELTISLIRTAPRLIRELHKELIKRAHWKSLCTPADGRVKQASLESNLKNDVTVKDSFRELLQILRSAFTKAPRWFPEDMKYFFNAVCGGRYKLRGIAGMGPVVDLLINLAWREVWISRDIVGLDSDNNPIGVFIPGGRRPGQLAYLEHELQQPWDDMWEVFEDS